MAYDPAYARAYYLAHREEILAKQKHRLDKAKRRAYHQAYYAANKTKILARQKARREQYHAEVRAYQNAYYAAHAEHIYALQKRHAAKNADRTRLKSARRRARQRGILRNDLTVAQWQAIKAHYGHRCVYCGQSKTRLTMDHLTPLSQGGAHTVHNVVPACRSCNAKKGTGRVLHPVQPLLFT